MTLDQSPLWAARKVMIDLSTAHITEKDSKLLQASDTACVPRVQVHEYGYIIFVDPEDYGRPSDSAADKIENLRRTGYSDALISIYEQAAKIEDCILINFDQDGPTIEGLPTFDW